MLTRERISQVSLILIEKKRNSRLQNRWPHCQGWFNWVTPSSPEKKAGDTMTLADSSSARIARKDCMQTLHTESILKSEMAEISWKDNTILPLCPSFSSSFSVIEGRVSRSLLVLSPLKGALYRVGVSRFRFKISDILTLQLLETVVMILWSRSEIFRVHLDSRPWFIKRAYSWRDRWIAWFQYIDVGIWLKCWYILHSKYKINQQEEG